MLILGAKIAPVLDFMHFASLSHFQQRVTRAKVTIKDISKFPSPIVFLPIFHKKSISQDSDDPWGFIGLYTVKMLSHNSGKKKKKCKIDNSRSRQLLILDITFCLAVQYGLAARALANIGTNS